MDPDDLDGGREHKLVMYASSGLLDQYFKKYADDISRIIKRESQSTTKELSGGINSVVAKLRGLTEKKSGREMIEEINLNDEYHQVRALMNIFSDTDLVYPVKALEEGSKSPTGLYKFDTDLQLYHTDGINEEEKMIKVRGIKGDIDFSGFTSPENWSSRSFVLTALRNVDPFPFEGIFMPVETDQSMHRETRDGYELEMLDLTVKYLYILAPDTEDYNSWSNYQKLLSDHPKEIDQSGFEEQGPSL